MSHDTAPKPFFSANAQLRRELTTRLRTDSEFDAFCHDYFPAVSKGFSQGMDRTQKITRLLHEDLDQIRGALAFCMDELLHVPAAATPVIEHTLPAAAALGQVAHPAARSQIVELPPPNPYFMGRDALLTQIQDELHERQGVVLTGLGGVGKTQLALALGHALARREYQLVYWLDASPSASIQLQLLELAKRLDLSESSDAKPERLFASLRQYLNGAPSWLLIVDGMVDVAQQRTQIPRGTYGQVLLTTRSSDAALLGLPTIEVLPMDGEEAVAFLRKRSGRSSVTAEDNAAAIELVRELGGLPLALEQAAIDLHMQRTPVPSYLKKWREDGSAILNCPAPQLPAHSPGASVNTTWRAELQALRSHSESYELLVICAFLPMDRVSTALFREYASSFSDRLRDWFLTDELEDLLAPLLKSSLVRRHTELDALSVHPLLRAVVRDELSYQERSYWVRRVAHVLAMSLCSQVELAWPEFSTMWPGLRTLCCEALKVKEEDDPYDYGLLIGNRDRDRELLCSVLLQQLSHQAMYDEALNLYDELWQSKGWRPKPGGPGNMLQQWNQQALLQHARGSYALALNDANQAIVLFSQLGSDHGKGLPTKDHILQAIRSVCIQADVQRELGMHADALRLIQQAAKFDISDRPAAQPPAFLEYIFSFYHSERLFLVLDAFIEETAKFFASGTPSAAEKHEHILHRCADSYREQQRYQQAEESLLQLLALVEKRHAPDDEVCQVLVALRELYGADEWQRPHACAAQQLKIQRLINKALAEPGYYTAEQLATLAESCTDYAQAKQLFILAQTGASDRPGAQIYYRFARCAAAAGDDTTYGLFEQYRQSREQVLRPEHPKLVLLQRELADRQGDEACKRKAEFGEVDEELWASAAQKFRDCWTRLETTYQPTHDEVLNTFYLRARKECEQGLHDKARNTLNQILVRCEKAHGKLHARLATVHFALADLELDAGQLAAAKEHCLTARQLVHRHAGEQHPRSADNDEQLARICLASGELQTARELFTQVLAKQEAAWGEQHPLLRETLEQQFHVLVQLDEMAAAEACQLRRIFLHQVVYGEDHAEMVRFHVASAQILRSASRNMHASKSYVHAISCSAKIHGGGGAEHAAQLFELGTALFEIKEFSLATDTLRRAIAIYESLGRLGISFEPTANSWQLLGRVHEAANEWEDAAAAYGREFTLREAESENVEARIAAGERQLRLLSRLKCDSEAEVLHAALSHLRLKLPRRPA